MSEDGDWSYRNVIFPAVARLLGNAAGLHVLDGGCGTGSLSRFLAAQGCSVTGVDFSDKMLDHAIRRESQNPRGIKYYCADLITLPKPFMNPFDVVFTDFTLQDSDSPHSILAALRKCLNNTGRHIAVIEHPFFAIFDQFHVTTHRNWLTEPDGPPQSFLDTLFRYSKPNSFWIIWKEKLKTLSHHRTIEEYVRLHHEAGFIIQSICEPTSIELSVDPEPEGNLTSRIPLFLLFDTIPAPF
jgi:ubiquinone/menaquinone biosynthesis C-methylase UbiE